jgi:spoIIIJ-associated protein
MVFPMDRDALKALVSNFFKALGTSAEVSISGETRTVIAVSSSDPALTGLLGENLQALNLLIRRMVEMKHGTEAANFLIDLNGFHESKLQALRDSALLLAQRARLFHHDVELSPMSAYERLVIHELFAGDPELETRSEGEGKTRHIVLKYKNSEKAESL